MLKLARMVGCYDEGEFSTRVLAILLHPIMIARMAAMVEIAAIMTAVRGIGFGRAEGGLKGRACEDISELVLGGA